MQRKKSLKALEAEGEDGDDDAGRREAFLKQARLKRRGAGSEAVAAIEGDRDLVGVVAAIEVCLDWDRVQNSFATSFEPQRHTTMVLGRPVQVPGTMYRRERLLIR